MLAQMLRLHQGLENLVSELKLRLRDMETLMQDEQDQKENLARVEMGGNGQENEEEKEDKEKKELEARNKEMKTWWRS